MIIDGIAFPSKLTAIRTDQSLHSLCICWPVHFPAAQMAREIAQSDTGLPLGHDSLLRPNRDAALPNEGRSSYYQRRNSGLIAPRLNTRAQKSRAVETDAALFTASSKRAHEDRRRAPSNPIPSKANSTSVLGSGTAAGPPRLAPAPATATCKSIEELPVLFTSVNV